MSRNANFLFATILLACLTTTGLAELPSIPESTRVSVRARVDYGYSVGIVIGLVNAEGRTFFPFGRKSFDSEEVPDENTLFEIGSVTKVFTSTLLAEMVQRGEVGLTDTVQSLLPAEVTMPQRNGKEISFLHLATHASGLPSNPSNLAPTDSANPFVDYTEDRLYDFLNGFSLPRNPGASYEYSNVGVGLLGHALARRLGLSYESALRERILEPMRLVDTTITLTPDQIGRRATGHSGVVPRPPFVMNSLEAAGGIFSTANDLLTFLEYQIGLKTNGLEAAVIDSHKVRRATDLPGISIGLGWWVWSLGSGDYIQHGGDTIGQTAFLGFKRGGKVGVVVLSNTRTSTYATVTDLGFHLLDATYPLNAIAKPPSVPVTTLQSYFGHYAASDGTSFDIGLQQNHLTFSYSGDGGVGFTLYPDNVRRFRTLEPGLEATATFTTNQSGNVISMTWNQSGQNLKFNKVVLPARLAIARRQSQLDLTLTGDTGIDYIIEGSDDLAHWTALSTNTIWTGTLTNIAVPNSPRYFFRARSP